MRTFRAWAVRLMGVFGGRRRDRELADEIASHLQLHIDDNLRSGMSPEEARRAALLKFGGIEATRQLYRERRGLPGLDHFAQDLAHAVRMLRVATSWGAIGMLAVAIGVTTAMFAVLDALILKPVPFRDADRLAHVYMAGEHGGFRGVKPAVLRAWRASSAFDGAEGVTLHTSVLDTDAGPISRPSASVTRGLFDMLGVRPVRGRVFDAGEVNSSDRALISEDLWRSAFGGRSDIVGQTGSINGERVSIIGILPAGFRFPEWNTEIWRPIDDGAAASADSERLVSYLRRRKDVPEDEALRLATAIGHEVDPSTRDMRAVARPVSGFELEAYYYQHAMPLLGGGVVFVFLALCANVSGLLLTRFNARRREFSLRTALGASRGRLLRQALVESGTLGAAGAVGGVALASQLVALARRLLPEAFLSQTLHPLHLDLRALLVAAVCGVVATLAAGLLPAVVATQFTSTALQKIAERGATETRAARAVMRGILIGEIALACTLLIGATLLVRSFVNLSRVDRGFDPRGLLSVEITFDARRAPDRESRLAAVRAADEAITGLPEVQRAVWAGGAPHVASDIYSGDWSSDRPGAAPVNLTVDGYRVGPDFFSMYGLQLLRGRTFAPDEDPNHAVIGDRLASALWPGADPVGHTVRWGQRTYEIVGVVRELNRPVLDARLNRPEIYLPFRPGGGYQTLGIRCGATCPSEGVIRRRLLSVPALQVRQVQELEGVYRQDLAQPRATAALGAGFATIGLLAAAGGLFSALSAAVGRRRREFGIRLALGASANAIRRLVVRDGITVILSGLGIGGMMAWILAKAVSSLEFGVTATDPVSWGLVLATLAVTVLLAAWNPVRAAMRINPVSLLRDE